MGINQKSDRNDPANVDAKALVSFVRGLPLNLDAVVSNLFCVNPPSVAVVTRTYGWTARTPNPDPRKATGPAVPAAVKLRHNYGATQRR